MREKSTIRDMLIDARCRLKGGVQADHYEAVFDRWVRIYGPEICLAPSRCAGAVIRQDTARILANVQNDSDGVSSAAKRIEAVIRHSATSNAFWSRVSGDWVGGFVLYIRGNRYAIFDNDGRKLRRMLDLLMLYRIISTGKVYEDTVSGVGKIMESMNDREKETFDGCS